MQVLCHVYTVHRLCRHFPHVSQDICSAPSSAGRPTQEPAVAVHGAGVGGLTQEPAVAVHEVGARRPTLAVENSYAVYQGGGGGGSPVMVLPVSPSRLYNEL